jgi:hypothetical protein
MPPAPGVARYATVGTLNTVNVDVSADTTDTHTTHHEMRLSLTK